MAQKRKRPLPSDGDFIEELRDRRLARISRGEAVPTARVPGEFVLPNGLPFPKALLPDDIEATRPAPVVAAKKRIAETFKKELSEALAEPDVAASPELTSKAYESAKIRADRQYKMMFGDVAANQAGIHSMLEARQAE